MYTFPQLFVYNTIHVKTSVQLTGAVLEFSLIPVEMNRFGFTCKPHAHICREKHLYVAVCGIYKGPDPKTPN